jgi:hypothetical protein
MPKLYGADGGVAVQDEKNVTPISQREIVMLSMLHEFAQKHGIAVVCRRCDSSFAGQNNDSSSTLAIACQCREFRFTK